MLKEFSNPEYFEIRDAKTLSKKINRSKKYRAFVATKFMGVRLIDNLAIN
jgi:pantothenate synthetase